MINNILIVENINSSIKETNIMIDIVICDDEQAEIFYLAGLVQKWAAEQNISIKLTDYTSAESFLFSYEDNKAVDILLLDIQMGKMDGVELAKKVRANNKEVQIIFVTGYMEYIADGYDVEALHYLLKPVTEEKLIMILNRALKKLAGNERAVYINHSSGNIRIPMYEIRYLEVRHNYVTVIANEGYTVKKTLAEMEKELDENFFRTGRSYIINLKFIRKVTKTEVHLKEGTVIPLSRGLYDKLNRAMIERL